MARSRPVALIVSVRKIARTVYSLRLADLESPSGTDIRRVFLCPHIRSPRGLHMHIPSKKTKSWDQGGTNLFLLRSPIQTAAVVRHSARSSVTLDAVDAWMGGRAAASQPQHQHPQADHVGTHVLENADAPHRPGWALRWRTGAACGLSGMRQS